MSKCQKDVKLSKRCQMSKGQTHRLWRRFTKKINWHNEVHTFWRQFLMSHMMVTKNPQNVHRKCLNNFGDLHIWRQNWYQYVWTSLYQFIFFVNLLHSLCVWLFDIWHLFDNLTSFWQLDIFFDTWAMWHMANGAHGQWGTWVNGTLVNTTDTDGGPWGMGQ